jgi:hypothetical protein
LSRSSDGSERRRFRDEAEGDATPVVDLSPEIWEEFGLEAMLQ